MAEGLRPPQVLRPSEAPAQPDLRAYLRVLVRRKVTIAVVTVLILGLAAAYLAVKTPVYTASTQVLVPEQSATSVLQSAGVQPQLPTTASLQRTLLDAQHFAQGDQTKKAALAILHRSARVEVSASETADLLTFTADSTVKAQAVTTANGYAHAFITANQANAVDQFTSQVEAIQARIAKLQQRAATLPPKSPQLVEDRSSITSLAESVQQMEAASQLVASTSPTILDLATTPVSPSSPKLVRDAVLALILGLLLGTALAFLRDRLDDKVASTRDVEESSGGRPVVGSIPEVDSWRKDSTPHVALIDDSASAVSEAYRTLRTAIQFLGVEEPHRVIGITSSKPDEGKSTTTSNLAVSFARAGQRVVAVSFDFRRPRLHLFFGLANDAGATSVLLGQTTLKEALSDVPGEPNLRILPSGPVPPNPAEILSLDRVRHLVDVLVQDADVVIIDCPPTLPVTDTLLISRLCDALLVLAVAGVTKRGDLRRTHQLLEQVQAPVRGTIVNRVPSRGAHAAGYGYGYGYGYDYGGYRPVESMAVLGVIKGDPLAPAVGEDALPPLGGLGLGPTEHATGQEVATVAHNSSDEPADFGDRTMRYPNGNGSVG